MVSDLKTFTNKGCKIAVQKKVSFLANFALPSRIFLVSVFFTPFNGLFASTSWRRMSNIFRDSESLGKSNGKKWSNIWTFLFESFQKSPRKKKNSFWANFALLSRIFLVSVFLTQFNGLFAPTSRSLMSKNFRDSESLGKSNGKKWSNIWNFLFASGLKSPREKKKKLCWFCLTKHVENHASRWIRDFWSKGISLILAYL